MESPLSSAVSISSFPSEISDVNMPQNHVGALVPEINGKRLFEPGDGDMGLIVNGTRFETHRYLIKRFKKWRDLSPKLEPGSSMSVTGTASSDDFLRMLRVLYSTTLEGPSEFDISTLVSSLHIATEYEYPALRDYAIAHLEKAELTAIKRIEIARKFDLPSWEKPAYMDLCNRDEAITEEEANILGIAAFVRVAKIREREQRRRGSRIDVEQEEKTIKSEHVEVDLNQGTNRPPSSGDNDVPKKSPPCLGSKRSSKLNPLNWANEPDAEATKPEVAQDQTEDPIAKPQPCFADLSKTGLYHSDTHLLRGLPALGCSCRYLDDLGLTHRTCILPPCAVATLKNLKNEQLAHTERIADIRSSLDKLQITSNPEPSFNQEANAQAQSLTNVSVHEEVLLMLAELS